MGTEIYAFNDQMGFLTGDRRGDVEGVARALLCAMAEYLHRNPSNNTDRELRQALKELMAQHGHVNDGIASAIIRQTRYIAEHGWNAYVLERMRIGATQNIRPETR